MVIFRSKKVTGTERKRVAAFIPLYIASAAFWALFQQQFTFIAVYSEEKLDRNLFGWEMPAAWVQSINPVFIIIFAGVFAALWTRLGRRQPGSALKFSLGLFVMGLAFLAFIPLAGDGKTPLLALVGILLLFTLAELFLSPIGLSVTTKLAPKAFHTQMVALFFLSVSLGTTLAGILAGLYYPEDELRTSSASAGPRSCWASAWPRPRRRSRSSWAACADPLNPAHRSPASTLPPQAGVRRRTHPGGQCLRRCGAGWRTIRRPHHDAGTGTPGRDRAATTETGSSADVPGERAGGCAPRRCSRCCARCR